jgi:hypothetical protein
VRRCVQKSTGLEFAAKIINTKKLSARGNNSVVELVVMKAQFFFFARLCYLLILNYTRECILMCSTEIYAFLNFKTPWNSIGPGLWKITSKQTATVLLHYNTWDFFVLSSRKWILATFALATRFSYGAFPRAMNTDFVVDISVCRYSLGQILMVDKMSIMVNLHRRAGVV